MAGEPYRLDAKLPDEAIFADFDFTDLFKVGVTIASQIFEITVLNGTDAAPDNMKSGGIGASGLILSQLLVGGVPGVTYQLKMKATGSDTSVQNIILILPVVAVRYG